jgi:aminomethyltransferase
VTDAHLPSGKAEPLRRTPLYSVHLAQFAHMGGFAGYEMPLRYAAGVIKEHLHTRTSAGLFDISHMGQLEIRPKSGGLRVASFGLEGLMPVDVVGLKPGRQRYAVFTNNAGGILDDLMIANRGDCFFLVVNASRQIEDIAHLRARLPDNCEVVPLVDRALLALQGPKAEAVLSELTNDLAGMSFMDVRTAKIQSADCIVSRSGYTGEDGFEISVHGAQAESLWNALVTSALVQPIGLVARDSLRLEAGLCLYGNDIDESTSPVEAGLEWAIQRVRRATGARAGGFPGADRILAELAKQPMRRRVGLKPEGRAIVRAGAPLFGCETGTERIGTITSGGFGPSLEAPIAMGYVRANLAEPGTRLFTELRGKRIGLTVGSLPFTPARYKRY